MTDEITFTSDMQVKLVRAMMADEFVVQTAQVSSKGENEIEQLIKLYEEGKIDIYRFINALMKGKHGSPFEHNMITLYVKAPIFVFREWMRHRIGSFNEMSGRYTKMEPEFYITPPDRKMINIGTSMKPEMIVADEDVWLRHVIRKQATARFAWKSYEDDVADGIAKEVAREDLPLNIMSQMYWTVNARSLMNFLSLRSRQDGAAHISYPQREIQICAEKVEDIFAELMPLTYKTFVENGRIAP